MTFITHSLITAAGVQLFGLKGIDVVWAYMFGVVVDLDHLIKLPGYIKKVGWKRKKHYNWRTSLQEPVSLLWVVPFSVAVGSVAPTIFLLAHMALDYLVSYEKRPFWPFSNFVTRGFWVNGSDRMKEVAVIVAFGCINLFLWLIQK